MHFHRNSDTNDEERTVRFVETKETESRAVVKEVRTVKILSDGELAQKEFSEANSERRIIWREETESSEISQNSVVRGGKRHLASASREILTQKSQFISISCHSRVISVVSSRIFKIQLNI